MEKEKTLKSLNLQIKSLEADILTKQNYLIQLKNKQLNIMEEKNYCDKCQKITNWTGNGQCGEHTEK